SLVTLLCEHDNSDHYRMYWYRQIRDSVDLQLLSYSAGPKLVDIEPPFNKAEKYKVKRLEVKKATLQITKLETADTGSYFCATSRGYQAYFGAGTKLTVLDPNAKITPPAVKILGPNLAEKCKNGRVTVVCVATGFYPDHVEVFWQINGLNQIEGVATDNAARKKSTTESSYKISSRLTTTYKEWNKGSQYTCTVTFFNGTEDAPMTWIFSAFWVLCMKA
uniref:Ig-like domain-containing protein n=1 Tax=Electrophorus electricus TaxID=8005 RepID=A0A4W4EYR0_ELEEL